MILHNRSMLTCFVFCSIIFLVYHNFSEIAIGKERYLSLHNHIHKLHISCPAIPGNRYRINIKLPDVLVTAIDRNALSNKTPGNVALGDFDSDGDIDIYRAVFSGQENKNDVLFQNKGNNNNWLTVKLKGVESNSYGIGSRVKVMCNNLFQVKELTYNLNTSQQNSYPLEFGIANNKKIDTLEVCWPSGNVDIILQPALNQMITIREGYGEITLPSTSRLRQNYPNPFNSSTIIEYSVGNNTVNHHRPVNVKITIYNILGQRVKTLVDGSKEPGIYSVRWNGMNENGYEVSSGVYFITLHVHSTICRKKLLLIR